MRRRILSPAECLGGYPTPRGADGLGCGVGCRLGIASRAAWTPASIGGDFLFEDALVLGTQPTVPGAGWAGTNWSGSGMGGYTHTAGNTTALTLDVLSIGLRYLTSFTVSGMTAGTVTHAAGNTAGTARSANGTYIEELTCATNGRHGFTPSSDFDGVVMINSVKCLSVSETTCLGTLGKLVQADVARMPWSSDPSAPVSVPLNYKPVICHGQDAMASDQAASSWDWINANGSAWSYYLPVKSDLTVWCGLLKNWSTFAAANPGLALAIDTGGRLRMYIADGSNTQTISAASNTVAANTWYLIEVHRAADDTITVIQSGTERIAPTAITRLGGAASNTLNIGQLGGSEFISGCRGKAYLYKGALSAANKAKVRAWYNAQYNL